MNSPEIAPDVGQLILTLRGQRVILDSDLAKLYGVRTRRFHSATTATCRAWHTRRHTNSFRSNFDTSSRDLAYPVRGKEEDHLLTLGP